MNLRAVASTLFRWGSTLKFKIVVMAVITGVVSALASAQLVLATTQDSMERMLLQSARADRERTAVLLANKLDMLKITLQAVSQRITPQLLADQAAVTQFVVDKPALNALFDSVLVVRHDGALLARLEKGIPRRELPSIADREYFQRVMRTSRTVVSQPVVGKVSKKPLALIAVPVLGGDGHAIGSLVGSVALQSSTLFSDMSGSAHESESRDLVLNRAGVLVAHTDLSRVMGKAADEPGLTPFVAQWLGQGEQGGDAQLSAGFLASWAVIPASDWMLLRLTPQAVAMAPLAEARQTAWRVAAAVGLIAAMLSGLVAWLMTRPISSLRAIAEDLLTDAGRGDTPWPQAQGEVGNLSKAFQTVVEQRQRRQDEIQALVHQLEAVFDHAQVGITLTRNGRFELVSKQFCHIFRLDKQHAVGQPTRMIYASDADYEALSARAKPSFMAHGAFDGEWQLMRRNGQLFWAHMRGRVVVAGDRSQGTIWTIEDVTEAREQRERLTYTAAHDSLTGLANRDTFENLLEGATARSAEVPFCTLFIDLDGFKQVNDSGGHAAGDAMLRDIAAEIAHQLRKSDTVARLGGDEFGVLLANCPPQQAGLIAEKIRAAVRAYRLVWEGQTFGVGASVGLVHVSGDHASAADALRAADAACYAAKRQGRDRVAVHIGGSASDQAIPA